MGNRSESIGISLLKLVLDRTGRVDSDDIRQGEKGVSWDGDIKFYSDRSLKKDKLFEIIPVQVKSHEVGKIKKSRRHPIYKADLNNFLLKRFVIFFVIDYLKDAKDFKIYYRSMLQIDLQQALDSFEGKQSSKSFDFEEFPTDKDKIVDLLNTIATNNKKINNLIPGIHSLKMFSESRPKAPISFDCKTFSKNPSLVDIIKSVEEQKPYLYYRSTDTGLNCSIDKFVGEKIKVFYNKNVNVFVNGELLFDNIRVEADSQSETVHIGNFIQFKFDPSTKTAKFNFQIKGDIQSRVKTLTFISAIINGEEISFNDNPLKWGGFNSALNLAEIKRFLEFYKKVDALFSSFGIIKAFDPDSLTEKDFFILQALFDCYFENKTVNYLDCTSGFQFIHPYGLNILCVALVNDKNEVFLASAFDDCFRLNFMDEKGKIIFESASPYFMLSDINDNPFFRVDNVNYLKMIQSVFSGDLNDSALSKANNMLLNMLSFYDSNHIETIIKYALEFASEIVQKDNNNIVFLFNYLQTLARTRRLTENELEQIKDVLASSDDIIFQASCYVLLEDKSGYSDCLARMNEDERKVFFSFPISNLAKQILNTKSI